VVFTRDYPGTVLLLNPEAADAVLQPDGTVVAPAGMVLDRLIQWTLERGVYGLENLSAIPGTVGASVVQNVGAYGVEAKDIVYRVRAFEIATGVERVFTNEECQFAYRNSVFKGALKDRYIIWSVVFRLHKQFTPNLQYKALLEALQAAGIEQPTPQQLADIITDFRWRKLPRPEETGSAGSFFKNPVVSVAQFEELRSAYPDIVAYPISEGYKLAAGWLIERAGWKGRSLGRCGVYDKQALVLVNHGGCTGAEVVALADAVAQDVRKLFGVTLEKEAIII
jgi:UDP-N-acetylmuramate dehydrogenase